MTRHTQGRPARDWCRLLRPYARPNNFRAIAELGLTAGAFALLWALAFWASMHAPVLLVVALPLAAGFLARLFVIQHDCGHRSYFRSRTGNDWCGRIIGVVTFTPYEMWRRNHSVHHTSSGNLGRRRDSDIRTLTVAEYRALSPAGRALYRLYRHPFTLFVFGPAWVFLLKYRLPIDIRTATRSDWLSVIGTNFGIGAAVLALGQFVGPWRVLALHVPIVYLTGMLGVWMFYVQHQFAALDGSSHYALPAPLAWITGYIGAHHVHHLSSRIPFYNLPAVLRDFPELAAIGRIGLADSLGCARLSLWHEGQGRLVRVADIG